MKLHRGARIFLTYFSSSVSGNQLSSDANVMLFLADSSQLNLHLSFGTMSENGFIGGNDEVFPFVNLAALLKLAK